MLEQGQVATYLRNTGLLSARPIMMGDLLITNSSRRNSNFQVVCEQGASFMLKQSADTGSGATLRREALMYEYLHSAPGSSALRQYLPGFYSFDERERILVLEFVRGAVELHAYQRRIGRFPVWIGAQIGEVLASLHSDAAHAEVFRQSEIWYNPWILSVHQMSPSRLRDTSSAGVQLVSMVQQTTELRSLLGELLGRWQPGSLVHGDIKGSNWLVVREQSKGRKSSLKLIDWEMAGTGDARWDVGSVFADYLALWLFSMALNTEEDPEQYVSKAGYPLGQMQPAISRFWQAYVVCRGFGDTQATEFLSGAVLYAGARLVQTAYEQCQELTRVSLTAVALLQLALNIMQKPVDAAADLLGIDTTRGDLRE